MANDIPPKPAPDLKIPQSQNWCDVSIIDTTTVLTVPDDFLVEPHIEGKDWLYEDLPHIHNEIAAG
jgi:hypothetical protein